MDSSFDTRPSPENATRFDAFGKSTSSRAHEAYFFCYDNTNPDVICVFQLYTDKAAMEDFLKGAWYPDYLNEVSQYVAFPPHIIPADLVWEK